MSAQQNTRNPLLLVIPVGSLATDDTQVPAFVAHRKMSVKSVKLMNGAAITASDTDYVQVSLKNGSNSDGVVAELDSRAAHENGLAKNVAKDMNLSSSEATLDEGDSLYVDYQEAGTIALTSAVLVVEAEVLGCV